MVLDARKPLLDRFLVYQRERFPLAKYTPLVLVFTVSAATFSRFVRAAPGTVPLELLLTGAWTALSR